MSRDAPTVVGLNDDDDAHSDDYGDFQLRALHRYLRQRADRHVRDVEALVLYRARGYSHGKVRELLKLSPERYREVNRWAREATAHISLGRRRDDD